LQPLSTVKQCLDWSYAQWHSDDLYFGHGTNSAWDEAVWLVLHVMALPLDSGNEALMHPVNLEQQAQIKAWVAQRLQTRKPFAYLLQQAWFMGMPFYVDERVLVPRSPFAEWVGAGFQPWLGGLDLTRALELGTGSG
jgi:ribosomal protein L3 glutamine methyltransferase